MKTLFMNIYLIQISVKFVHNASPGDKQALF